MAFTVGQFAFQNYLAFRQYSVLHRPVPPISLKKEISQEIFEKSQDYSRSKIRFGIFSDVYSLIQNIAIIQYDLMPRTWVFAGLWMSKNAKFLPRFMGGSITQSLIFLFTFVMVSTVVSLPISYYSNFVMEEKYGFNKLTIKLWLTDMIKGLALGIALGGPTIAAFLKIIEYFGDSFIGYAMAFMFGFQLLAMSIFPLFIQPLFNKFTPLEDGELKTAIEALATQQKFPLSKLYVVDGSKRSSHSNAYFTGLPWSKQIVIYDTLISHSSIPEVVAVLAHEIGHWKLNHLPRMMLFSQAHLLLVFSMFSAFVKNKSLYSSFGFNTQPIIIGFILFNDIFTPVECVLQFGMNLLSRKHEFEADRHARECGYADELAHGLIKLLSQNLSTMDADWLFSAFHFSHPILSERLSAIGYESKEKIGADIDPLKSNIEAKKEQVVEKGVEKVD